MVYVRIYGFPNAGVSVAVSTSALVALNNPTLTECSGSGVSASGTDTTLTKSRFFPTKLRTERRRLSMTIVGIQRVGNVTDVQSFTGSC
jgi:hypothetical protein